MNSIVDIQDVSPNYIQAICPQDAVHIVDVNPNVISIQDIEAWFAFAVDLCSYVWVGNMLADNLKNQNDNRVITITGKDFTGQIIPSTSTATFALPADADFVADDMDEVWFTGGVPNKLTVADLIGTDWARTLVLYPNVSPANISAIALLKSGVVLTQTERDQFVANFLLWLFWDEKEIKN